MRHSRGAPQLTNLRIARPQSEPAPQWLLNQHVLYGYEPLGQLVTGAGRAAMALSVPKPRKRHWWERAITLPKPARSFLKAGGGFIPAALVAAPMLAPTAGRALRSVGRLAKGLIPQAPSQTVTVTPPGGVPVEVPYTPTEQPFDTAQAASGPVMAPAVSYGGEAVEADTGVGPGPEAGAKALGPGLLVVGGLVAVGLIASMRSRRR
jgi:hypothetical protein